MAYHKDESKGKDLFKIINSAPIKEEYKGRIGEVLQAQYDEINFNERNEFAAMGCLDTIYYVILGKKWATVSEDKPEIDPIEKEGPGVILKFPSDYVISLGEIKGKKWYFHKKGCYGLCEILDEDELKKRTNAEYDYLFKVVEKKEE
jgi:hypothetical protein